MVTSSNLMNLGRTILGERVDPGASFRFEVKVDDIYFAAFNEIQLPSLQMETLPIKEGGQNQYVHKLPVRVEVGTVTLRQGVTYDLKLLNWYLNILNGDVSSAMRTVSVTMYSAAHTPMMTFQFGRAMPVKWSGPSLKADADTIALEEIEFAYHEFSLG